MQNSIARYSGYGGLKCPTCRTMVALVQTGCEFSRLSSQNRGWAFVDNMQWTNRPVLGFDRHGEREEHQTDTEDSYFTGVQIPSTEI